MRFLHPLFQKSRPSRRGPGFQCKLYCVGAVSQPERPSFKKVLRFRAFQAAARHIFMPQRSRSLNCGRTPGVGKGECGKAEIIFLRRSPDGARAENNFVSILSSISILAPRAESDRKSSQNNFSPASRLRRILPVFARDSAFCAAARLSAEPPDAQLFTAPSPAPFLRAAVPPDGSAAPVRRQICRRLPCHRP